MILAFSILILPPLFLNKNKVFLSEQNHCVVSLYRQEIAREAVTKETVFAINFFSFLI